MFSEFANSALKWAKLVLQNNILIFCRLDRLILWLCVNFLSNTAFTKAITSTICDSL